MATKSFIGATVTATESTTIINGITSSSENHENGIIYRKSNGYSDKNYRNQRILHDETYKEQDQSSAKHKSKKCKESFEEVSLITAALTRIGFYFLMLLGFVNELIFPAKIVEEKGRKGYAALYEKFDIFYLKYVYRRVSDCWNRPICSVPGSTFILRDRVTYDKGWTYQLAETKRECINMGSYNYLGFAEGHGRCAEDSIKALINFGCATTSTRLELGSLPIHDELEKTTARFLGVEDAIVFGMGFATNSMNIPSLASKGCLIISDERNHASLILGLKLSGATVKVFKHNNVKHLEKCLKEGILKGQPKTGEPWKKIIIVVEGIYSMEGSVVHLPEVIELKKKYRAYLYLDEAHSTGAMGKRGRGVCDYYGVNPRDVDILMGTFTKSFGSAGGYIAGTKALINYLRVYSHAHTYAAAMSPPVAQQIITSMRIIMGEDNTDAGRKRINQLARNTKYFRRRLKQIGVITYGHEDSPVVPMMVYMYSKIGGVIRTLTQRNIALVGVGFPATPLFEGRIRFCLSAAHTKEQLDYVLQNIEDISNLLGLKYSNKNNSCNTTEYYSDSETE